MNCYIVYKCDIIAEMRRYLKNISLEYVVAICFRSITGGQTYTIISASPLDITIGIKPIYLSEYI